MKIRRAVLDANPLCVICQKKGIVRLAEFVDHIKALMNGGTNDMDNYQGLCKDCHDAKTAQDKGHRVKQEIGMDGWPIRCH